MVRGYKIVNQRWHSFCGAPPIKYAVGETYRLPDDQLPVPCETGFHFCRQPLECLQYAAWDAGYHLLEVDTPDDAIVVADGSKLVSSALTVVADATASATSLLTGACETATVRLTYVRGHLHATDGEPSLIQVYKKSGSIWLSWHHMRGIFDGRWLSIHNYSDAVSAATADVIKRILAGGDSA
jgi:hypothetical protein